MTGPGKDCVCNEIYRFEDATCEPSSRYLCRLRALEPQATCFRLNGIQIDYSDGVAAAHRIISGSKCPLVTGLNLLGIRSQQRAVEIGLSARSIVDTGFESVYQESTLTLAREGMVTATIGEIARLVDLVLVLDCDPMSTYFRAFKKIVGNARKKPHLVVVGSRQNETTEVADSFIDIGSECLESAVMTLESLLSSRVLNTDCKSTKSSFAELPALASMLPTRSHITVITEIGNHHGRRDKFGSLGDSISSLVKALNRKVRTVFLGLRSDKNGMSAENVLTYNTGFPRGVDGTGDAPRSFGSEHCGLNALRRREVDSVLMFDESSSNDSPWQIESLKLLSDIPTIVVRSLNGPGNHCNSPVRKQNVDFLEIDNLDFLDDDFLRVDDLLFQVDSRLEKLRSFGKMIHVRELLEELARLFVR